MELFQLTNPICHLNGNVMLIGLELYNLLVIFSTTGRCILLKTKAFKIGFYSCRSGS
jgi:hypothetical protein